MTSAGPDRDVAFVLGGGGKLGTAEVGMLEALLTHGIKPDVILGTSIGAINGAAFAANPTMEGIAELRQLWEQASEIGVFGGRIVDRLRHMARSRISLHSNEPLRNLMTSAIGPIRIEDLEIEFQCVAACIETAAPEWFSSGPVVEAVLASAAVPGLLPPVEIDGRHYIDGGIVESIPIKRALDLGVKSIYVLQVGRIEEPLKVPKHPHEVALVSFEIARRRSFTAAMAALPRNVDVHVLPTGDTPPRFNDIGQLRYGDLSASLERIDTAKQAGLEFLTSLDAESDGPEGQP